MAAVELLPHVYGQPICNLSEAQITEGIDKAVLIARLLGDKFAEGSWGPTINPMPSIRDQNAGDYNPPTPTKPEWIRLPIKGKCPHSGLSRSSLYALVSPSEANDFSPPVKSVVIRNRGAARGIRLISYDSLMAYFSSIGASDPGKDET